MTKKHILLFSLISIILASCSLKTDGFTQAGYIYGTYRQVGVEYFIEDDDSVKVLLQNQDKRQELIGKRFFTIGDLSYGGLPESYIAKLNVKLMEEMPIYEPLRIYSEDELEGYRTDGILIDKNFPYGYLWSYGKYVNFIFGVAVADHTKHKFHYFINTDEEARSTGSIQIYIRHDASQDSSLNANTQDFKMFYHSIDMTKYLDIIKRGNTIFQLNYISPEGVAMKEDITIY